MTREEAIKRIDEQYKICEEFYYLSANPEKDFPSVMSYMEALAVAISALRPVSREQVEKAWRGEWKCHGDCGVTECSACGWNIEEYVGDYNFCPVCGAPMTDEAVEMVVERINKLEGMKNELG